MNTENTKRDILETPYQRKGGSKRFLESIREPIVGTIRFTMTPEEKAAHDKYVADEGLPF